VVPNLRAYSSASSVLNLFCPFSWARNVDAGIPMALAAWFAEAYFVSLALRSLSPIDSITPTISEAATQIMLTS
jgi:hypothetical protein